ncbi:bifunctional nuclease domain-containing protein [Actinopolymorpha sp. B9G3]|uniref:bifunctional nuclease domain-containing protein n=1 Tax=Actinopolymorpha sp. B9G3 TaxID=3158970 RepID=UPI0032D90B49
MDRPLAWDEIGLVAAARDGDKDAFAALVARHYPLVRALCARMLGDHDLAVDMAQEAVVAAMLALRRLRRDDRFGPWLAGIGLNLCRRHLQTESRPAYSLDVLASGRRMPEPVEQDPGPEELAEAAEAAHRVRAAVATLPAGQRDAVTLFYLAGLTQAEVAAHLDIPVGAVKTLLHKARASLRQRLAIPREEQLTMSETGSQLVPMRVTDVVKETPPDRHIVLLTEVDGQRQLPIWIGRAEAAALALSLEDVELPRPTAYQFAAALVDATGGRLREVRITQLTEKDFATYKVFYAQAVLEGGVTVDARPSDALNLALVTDVPIHVDPAVLDAAAAREPEKSYAQNARGIAAEAKSSWTRGQPE